MLSWNAIIIIKPFMFFNKKIFKIYIYTIKKSKRKRKDYRNLKNSNNRIQKSNYCIKNKKENVKKSMNKKCKKSKDKSEFKKNFKRKYKHNKNY